MTSPILLMRTTSPEPHGPRIGSPTTSGDGRAISPMPVYSFRLRPGAASYREQHLNRVGGERAPKDGPPTRFGGTALLLIVLCAALLIATLAPFVHAHDSSPSLATSTSTVPSTQVTLEAYNSGQVSYIAHIAHLLHAGDVVDLGRSTTNNTPDIATLNSWAAQLAPQLPPGVTITARVESLGNVRIAASSLSPLFGGVMVDYEPSTVFFPTWTWNFSVALAYYTAATAICHQYHRLAYAYPSGRALLEGDLLKYHWSYGGIAKVVDFVDIEAQSDANVTKWPTAITKLNSQFAAAPVPIEQLTTQISLGGGGNGVSESTAMWDARYAVNHSVDSIYIWWSMTTESWIVPIISEINNLTGSGEPTHLYQVTFTATGLPPGTAWWVNLTSGPAFQSNTSTLSFTEPNGSYPYTVASADRSVGASPSSGVLTVNGSAVSVGVAFSSSIFPVSFSQSGLPGDLPWSVTVTGQTAVVGRGASVAFTEPNGTYDFTIQALNLSYSADPGHGQFTVNGAGVSESVVFVPDLFPLAFLEQGLPAGTSFSVTVQGIIGSSTNGSIVWHELNGSYLYTVGNVPGYTLNGSQQGEAVVHGHSVTVTLDFVQAAGAGSSGALPSSGAGFPLVGFLAAAIAVGAAAGFVAWRLSHREPR